MIASGKTTRITYFRSVCSATYAVLDYFSPYLSKLQEKIKSLWTLATSGGEGCGSEGEAFLSKGEFLEIMVGLFSTRNDPNFPHESPFLRLNERPAKKVSSMPCSHVIRVPGSSWIEPLLRLSSSLSSAKLDELVPLVSSGYQYNTHPPILDLCPPCLALPCLVQLLVLVFAYSARAVMYRSEQARHRNNTSLLFSCDLFRPGSLLLLRP